MSITLSMIKQIAISGDVRVSDHGYDELANDGLTAREIVSGVENGILIEDYPEYPKGASVLVLQTDKDGQPVHVVWGIPKGHERPAVLVTAYRADPDHWNDSFMKRKR